MNNGHISIADSDTILDHRKITRLLDAYRIRRDAWGTPGHRSLKELADYHLRDRLFFKNGSGPLHIEVDVAVTHVYCYHKGILWELYEHHQEHRGHIITRPQFDGIGETARRTEINLRDTARRCLGEELAFHNPRLYELSGCLRVQHRGPEESDKWPNLITIWHRNFFRCMISPRIFRPEGYVENEKGRLIYFQWRPHRRNEPLFRQLHTALRFR